MRALLAAGKATPEQIGIAAASPADFDDHVLALSQDANIPVHFVHRIKAAATPDGQTVAALADILVKLGDFRLRTLFVLDEAHHAAPSDGAKYAIASQLTKSVRELSGRFEHRLFLTATPHNGHSNSFSALLEMLDEQRFTRGVEITPKDLDPIMVRHLKADLRRLGEAFPKRKVDAIRIGGLPADAPELDLWRRFAAYGELRQARIGRSAAAVSVIDRCIPAHAQGASQDLAAAPRRAARSKHFWRRRGLRRRQHDRQDRGPRPSAAAKNKRRGSWVFGALAN